MTYHTSVLPDGHAETRWREWLARGTASDRQTALRMRQLMLVLVAALVAWFFVELM
jgi:hypothetical protein